MCKISLILVFYLTCAWAKDEHHWGYPNLEENENEPFPKWGGLCDIGRAQSPINLSTRYALKGVYPKLTFTNYANEQQAVTLHNNGHTLQVSNFSKDMWLSGGGLNAVYHVEQLHLHWWSEHTINELRYPMEVHIVHRNRKYPNMTMAAQHSDGIAVVAVLYHESTTANSAIAKLLERLDDVKSVAAISKPVALTQNFILLDLFHGAGDYFTYAGSLTTPSCAESVTWIVFRRSFPVTLAQVNRFKEIESLFGQPLLNNYRPLQRSHNRAIVFVEAELNDDNNNNNNNNAAAAITTQFNYSFIGILISTIFLQLIK